MLISPSFTRLLISLVRSFRYFHHPSQAINDRILFCDEECETTKKRFEADIQAKQRQLELLNNKISSPDDPKGIESTIKNLNAEYEQLKLQQHREDKKNMAKLTAVTNELDECEEIEGTLKDTFQKVNEMILTELDDECGSMRERITSFNQEVNG